MKEGWEYRKLGDLANFISGYTPNKEEISNQGKYPYFKVAEMNIAGNELFMRNTSLFVNSPKRIYPKGSIIFPKNGGAIYTEKKRILEVDSVIDLNTEAIFPTAQVELMYLFFLLTFTKISSFDKGGGLPSLDIKKMSESIIPVPPLSEQQSIVDYLDSAFAKIDAMKANAEKSLGEAKALFQASLKEMLEPKEGWEEKTLLVLTSKIGSGATPKGGRKVYIDEGCHLIRSMNVQYNEFKYEDLAHITDEAAEQLKGVEIQENDVLFNITGASIARCCVVPIDALPARVNQHVSILRLKQDVLPRFLSYILNSPKHQRELLEIGEAGSTRQALTKTDLENHVICYPNIDSQTKLLCTLDSLKSKVDRLQENYEKISQECDALKQAILRQVFE